MPGMNEWDVSTAQIKKAHGYSAKSDYHKSAQQEAETKALAGEILRMSRSTLLIHFRFLEAALVRLAPGDETITGDIATDGRFLYYNSIHVCRCFKEARELPARDLMHVTLHCVFMHLFTGKGINADLWDLATDIAVENIINELNVKALYCTRQEKQTWLINKLKKELPRLTAERIYRYLSDQDLPAQEVSRIRAYFYADDHKIWHNPELLSSGENGNDSRSNGSDADARPGDMDSGSECAPDNADNTEGEEINGAGGKDTGERRDSGDEGSELPSSSSDIQKDERALSPEDIKQQWQEISRRIQVDIETSSSSYGENLGGFMSSIAEVNREKVDYAGFLRRFAVIGENTQINDDEFDYIFYTYGMNLYKDMPLVEPLEYKEIKRIREFVIAIDTSESVAGDTVQKFITKTWNILKQSENFFTRVNIHIIQCGARVEEDKKICSQEEFDSYISGMTLKGFGGTDFRPVFLHVESLIRQHEFTNLKGMIYFTDGYGTFPPMPPEYETAFVFIDNGREPPAVPPWAIKILMTDTDLKEL